MGRLRWPVAMLLVPALVLALALTGCGQRRQVGRASPEVDGLGVQSWLLRMDAYSGEDGETKQATYVSIVPSTGLAHVVRMPRLSVAEASGDQRALLVDAGHRWVLTDSRPAKADRARGLVRLTALQSGDQAKVVDVGRWTGHPRLHADWASFDPKHPGLLRVVDGRTVWVLNLETSAVKKEGVLPRRPGWIFGGGFNPNTGTAYIEDTGSFDTLPKGNGETDQRAIRRAGGRLLLGDNGRFRGLPSPGCGLLEGFQEGSATAGRSWAFCVVGRHVQVRALAAGGSAWHDYGKPTGDVLPANADPAFVLPNQLPRR